MAIHVHLPNRDSIPERATLQLNKHPLISSMKDKMMTSVLAIIGLLGFVYISIMICSANDCKTIDQISATSYNNNSTNTTAITSQKEELVVTIK